MVHFFCEGPHLIDSIRIAIELSHPVRRVNLKIPAPGGLIAWHDPVDQPAFREIVAKLVLKNGRPWDKVRL